MAQHDGLNDFRRSARDWLRSAETLAASSGVQAEHGLYLAGFALECAMKYRIILQEVEHGSVRKTLTHVMDRRRETGRFSTDLHGSLGHSLDLLLECLEGPYSTLSAPGQREAWNLARRWDNSSRYAMHLHRTPNRERSLAAYRGLIRFYLSDV